MKVNINNSSEQVASPPHPTKKNPTVTICELITADCASVIYVCISCTSSQVG